MQNEDREDWFRQVWVERLFVLLVVTLVALVASGEIHTNIWNVCNRISEVLRIAAR